jgi:hypothetical protein
LRLVLCLAIAFLLGSSCQPAIQPVPVASPSPITAATPPSAPMPSPTPAPSPTQAPAADIAYVKDGEIWLATVSGRQVRRLAHGGPFSALSWSPNGKLLAAIKGTGFATQLHVFDVVSGEDRSFDLHGYQSERPVWSRDSSMVALPLLEDRSPKGQIDPGDFGKIAVVRLPDGSTSTYDGRWVSWHPKTGELVVATMGSYSGGIFRDNSIVAIDLASGAQRTLMKVKDVPQDLQAEYQYPFGPSTILLAFPQISPDGARLAFTALGHTGLVGVMDLPLRRIRLFGFFYEGGAGYSVWSPDGRYLAYEGLPATGQGALGLVQVEAGKEVLLGGRPNGGLEDRDLRQPSWSASGNAVAVVVVDRAGQASIALLDVSGRQIGLVATGNVSWPAWNPARR